MILPDTKDQISDTQIRYYENIEQKPPYKPKKRSPILSVSYQYKVSYSPPTIH